jgi:hypothetical protein
MKNDEFVFWQMDGVSGIEGNILCAMALYERKSGDKADLVLANPIDLFGKKLDCVGFEVRVSTNVQPGTIWVGALEKPPVYAENARKEES